MTPESLSAAGVKRAASIGAAGVCIGLGAVAGSEADVVRAFDLREVASRFEDEGIAVPVAWAGHHGDALHRGLPGGAAERTHLWKSVEAMAEAGVMVLLFYNKASRPEDPDEIELAFEQTVRFCAELAAHAADHGVKIACHPWMSKPGLIHGFDRLIELCGRIEQEEFGICYCPGAHLAGDDMDAVRDALLPRIHFAHLRDHVGDYHAFTEVFPGTGEVGVAGLLRRLRDAGYRGLICPEHWGDAEPGRDIEAECVAYMQRRLTEP